MSDAYDSVLKGGLSLKGGIFKSKKKKKIKRKREEAVAAASLETSATDEGSSTSRSGGEVENDRNSGEDMLDKMLTPAQKKFREMQNRRENNQIKKIVAKTHRERVEEFNAALAAKTEHNDIPRCSAAGNG
ncbi:unnamed protein product [Discosporangium mesarthrocarpum]